MERGKGRRLWVVGSVYRKDGRGWFKGWMLRGVWSKEQALEVVRAFAGREVGSPSTNGPTDESWWRRMVPEREREWDFVEVDGPTGGG